MRIGILELLSEVSIASCRARYGSERRRSLFDFHNQSSPKVAVLGNPSRLHWCVRMAEKAEVTKALVQRRLPYLTLPFFTVLRSWPYFVVQ